MVASAGPVIVPSAPGEVTVGVAGPPENWNCLLWGPWQIAPAAAGAPVAVPGFVPGTQITGACVGDTIPYAAFINRPAG
ncbi:hypothetical protein [Nocardia sp. NPDC057455]|uniref:hypothetical protein n=1 Tax=Nocardia sp. NPDC057455 TaxID=3346138 RepID=UPI00366B22BA